MKYQPFETEHYFHIYNRGNSHEHIIQEKENYLYFLSLMKKYLMAVGDVYSYCLLPNHFHILFKFKHQEELPTQIKESKKALHQPFSNMFNAYTKAINKRYGRRGSLFQKHLKRIKVEDEQYLINLILYINTNSSHHNIKDYKTYPYSSYQSLISDKATLLKRQEVIDYFEDRENFKAVLQARKLDEEAMREFLLE